MKKKPPPDPNQLDIFNPPPEKGEGEEPVVSAEDREWLDKYIRTQYGDKEDRQSMLDRVKARLRYGKGPDTPDLPF